MPRYFIYVILIICCLGMTTSGQTPTDSSSLVVLLESGASVQGLILEPVDWDKTRIQREGDGLILNLRNDRIFKITDQAGIEQAKLDLKKSRPPRLKPRFLGSTQYHVYFDGSDSRNLASLTVGLFIYEGTLVGTHILLDPGHGLEAYLGLSIRQYLVRTNAAFYVRLAVTKTWSTPEATIMQPGSHRQTAFETGLGVNLRFWEDTYLDVGTGISSAPQSSQYLQVGITQFVK